MTSEIFSRTQFGITVGFHILFPTLNIGLSIFLAIMEGVWLKTRNPVYYKIIRYWTKIFALTFGMGVVTGVVMSYELGTNFGRFTNAIGPILGPLFSYEVLSAFFLEAGFLGVMLFGWKRIGPKIHYFSTLMVTFGTILSAFWILSANSWMQTPAGYHLVNGVFNAANWMQAIFNPSFIPRYFHMLLASLVTASFVVAGVSAWYLLRSRDIDTAKPCFSFALLAALILVPVQLLVGDTVGLEVHENQPIKTAAMEAVWQTQRGAPFVVFAIPDPKKEKNLFAITIPKAASFINTHSWNGKLKGLASVPRKNWPVVVPVFFSFRIMVGIGLIMLLAVSYGLWLRFRKQLYDRKWFLRACVWIAPLGFLATWCGWITAEMGRQPWVVYNLMRTSQGASVLPAIDVMVTLAAFVAVYGTIFGFYLTYLFKFIKKGPADYEIPPGTIAYLPYPKHEGLEHGRN